MNKNFHNSLKSFLLIAFVSAYIIINFFFISKYTAYPWWHSHGNDGDGSFAVTSVSLLNDARLMWIQHPAATLNSFNALCFRILGHIHPAYTKLLHLDQVSSLNEAAEILEISTNTARITAMILSVVLAIVIFFVVHRLTRNRLIAGLMAFYVATAKGYIIHTNWIRPESLNLIFLFLAIGIYFSMIEGVKINFHQRISRYILVGLSLGFCIFAKVQAGPALVIFVAALLVDHIINASKILEPYDISGGARWGWGLVVANVLLMPWWCFKRPDFMTEEFILWGPIEINMREVYGSYPEHVYLPLLKLFIPLVLFSILVLTLMRFLRAKKFAERFFPSVMFLNSIVIGIIFATYLVLLPASVSFEKYLVNTNHLIYAIMTNIFNGTYVQNPKEVDFPRAIHMINYMHKTQTKIFFMSPFHLMLGAASLSLIRLFQRTTRDRRLYIVMYCFFAAAFCMDFIACFRGLKPYIYSYYAIYSLCLLAVGLGLWMSLELRQFSVSNKGFQRILNFVFISFLVLHVLNITHVFYNKPVGDGNSTQDPFVEYQNVRSHAKPFWEIVDQSIKDLNKK